MVIWGPKQIALENIEIELNEGFKEEQVYNDDSKMVYFEGKDIFLSFHLNVLKIFKFEELKRKKEKYII